MSPTAQHILQDALLPYWLSTVVTGNLNQLRCCSETRKEDKSTMQTPLSPLMGEPADPSVPWVGLP